MKVLGSVPPTGEQLKVIEDYKPGTLLVRGAAGSGKTTTALLRLRFVTEFWASRVRAGHMSGPVRVLVLTFNRTLRGYIAELARQHVVPGCDVTLVTFGKWATNLAIKSGYASSNQILSGRRWETPIFRLGNDIGFGSRFLFNEVAYAMGRFLPDDLERYVEHKREGRGRSPRVGPPLRRRLLDEVIYPFNQWKKDNGLLDWNDLAVWLATEQVDEPYNVIVVDEAQDFSANQIRAIGNHAADPHSSTFVFDGAQRIYPQHFSWTEVGVTVRSSTVLKGNQRNTAEIAAFAAPLLSGVDLTEDSEIPDFASCKRHGPLPTTVVGRFLHQMKYVIDAISPLIQETDDSIAILHAQGGAWFNEVEAQLTAAGIAYREISRMSEWPRGNENVALSTLHSVKGLEFDHVFIVGLNQEVTPHGADQDDSELENYRRLLAMAIGRARKTVTLTYKETEASDLLKYLEPRTFSVVKV